MKYIYPDYYKNFRCIASECRHNCCIGWEIDIDEESVAYYSRVGGDMGKRLSQSISRDESVHFILGKGDRCPFLNENNLCDIILTLGEDKLCDICTEHPRFYNALPGRVEAGLGLCCEEAARLILGKRTPTVLECNEHFAADDEIILLRDRVLDILRSRTLDINSRISEMLSLCNMDAPHEDYKEWISLLLSLERLEDGWTDVLEQALTVCDSINLPAFDSHMRERQHEYEQLLVYFVYRHMANAPDIDDVPSYAGFAALGYMLIRFLGAAQLTLTGDFTFEDQVELCRRFSSETEYSEENRYTLLDILAK